MPECSDRDEFLLQAVGRGDLASFSRIVERHKTSAWRVAYRFSGNEEDASDIVQEAFLRLLDDAERYRPTAKFWTYFYQIISRLCLDPAKRKQPLLLQTVPDTPDPTPDITDTMMRQKPKTPERLYGRRTAGANTSQGRTPPGAMPGLSS